MYSLTGDSPISATAFLAASNASDSLLVPYVKSINFALKVVGSSPARFSALSAKVGTSFNIFVTFSLTALSSGFSWEIISLYFALADSTAA